MTAQTRLGNCSPSGGGTDGIEGLRVLYAEHNPATRRAVCRLLRVSGASVASAQDGLKATERALAETFDLVLMDLHMPHTDGFEAARALRAGGCGVPIVAVTADATAASRANALVAGFDAVLLKPFGLGDLIRALQLVRAGQTAQTGIGSPAAAQAAGPP